MGEIEISLKYLKRQGYGGVSFMSSLVQGCSAIVRESFPHAVYVHCASHSLYLALCHSYKIPIVRNGLETLKIVINYFRISPKCFTNFQQIV